MATKMEASDHSLTFPKQNTSSNAKKSTKWKEDSVKYLIDNSYYSPGKKRKDTEELNFNWKIINSHIYGEELSEAFDPLGLREEDQFQASPVNLQFYNIVNNPLNTLAGEQLKRRKDIRAIVVNPTAVNQKDKMFKEKLYGFLGDLSKQEGEPDPQLIKEELEAIEK